MSEVAATVRLRDVADVTVGFVGTMASEYVPAGIPFLRSLNVRPHRIDPADMRYVSPEFHQRISKSRLRPGDVVTVRTGKPGQTAVVPAWLTEANCSDLVITRPGPRLDSRWLSYYLNWIADSDIASHLVGAVQQHFNVRSAESLELPDLPLSEQRAIAEVLGALDDKIAANEQLIRTSLELGALRSRQWRTGLRRYPLGALANVVLGGTPSRANPAFWTSGSVPWLASGAVNNDIVIEPTELITPEALERSAAKMMPRGSTLLAITGATLGQVAWLGEPSSGNQSIVGVSTSSDARDAWLHFAIRAEVPQLLKKATGAAQQHVSKGDVVDLLVDYQEDVADAQGAVLAGLLETATALQRESRSLARLRDTLLPALMSGRMTVRAAADAVDEALPAR